MEIQDNILLEYLADHRLPVDFQMQRVRFPCNFVEEFLANVEKTDWNNIHPLARGILGIYHSLYHNPSTGELESWTEDSLWSYIKLAKSLPQIQEFHILGCRFPVPAQLEPLYERYYCWKYGVVEGGSIHLDVLCPYLLEIYEARAEAYGITAADAFRGTVYLIPPLKLGRHEAYQLRYFWERGMRVGIGGGMGTMGSTAPVTYAGAIALNLAEQLAIQILSWILFGVRKISLGVGISVMDMRSAIRRVGRPGITIANLMMAQIARYYGVGFSDHAGLADAKLPSVEAGAQKALSAVPVLLAGGKIDVYAGLLSMDEICSPIQLILDHELISAMGQFTQDFEIDEDTIGLQMILESGPGGHFLDKDHTAAFFRREHWIPKIWSQDMLQTWIAKGSKLDVDRSKQMVAEILNKPGEPPGMPSDLDRDLNAIIENARGTLVSS
jgi:trimethylamine--corrinoid protein Co-methyltransferase